MYQICQQSNVAIERKLESRVYCSLGTNNSMIVSSNPIGGKFPWSARNVGKAFNVNIIQNCQLHLIC